MADLSEIIIELKTKQIIKYIIYRYLLLICLFLYNITFIRFIISSKYVIVADVKMSIVFSLFIQM